MTNIETKFNTHLNADVVYEVKKDGFFDKRDIVTISEENQIVDATEMIPYESGFTCIEGTSSGIAPKTIKLSDYILPSQHYVNPEVKEALLYPIRNDVKQKEEEIKNFTSDPNIKIVDKVAYNFTGTEKITFGEKANGEKNYVIVGNARPTVEGIFSGLLNYNNYVAFPFENNTFNTFEITTSFSFSALSTYNAILDLNHMSLFLGVHQNKLQFYVGSSGNSWNIASQVYGTTTIQTNTRYWVKCGKSESTYYVKLSTDGKNFDSEIVVNSTARLASFDKLSIAYYTNDTNWIFNGTYYFSDLTFAAEGEDPKYLYPVKKAPYTKFGDIQVVNNIASNFSSTAYIRVNDLNLDTTKPWQFSTEVTITSMTNEMGIIGSANNPDIPCGFALGMSTSGQLILWLSDNVETYTLSVSTDPADANIEISGDYEEIPAIRTSQDINATTSSKTIPLNTPYNINVRYTGSSYIVEAKARDEETFVNFITINSSTPISNTIDFDLGIAITQFLEGTMNLKNTAFYNEDEIIWRGSIEPYYASNINMVGTVNIVDKIASNFSNTNYLIIPAPTEPVISYEIITKFKASTFDNGRVFGNSTTNIHTPQLEVPFESNNENLQYFHPNKDYSWSNITSSAAIEKDTWYWIKAVYAADTVVVYQRTENEDWYIIGSMQVDGCGWDQEIRVGLDQESYVFNGEIDLLETSIKINDKDFYSFYTPSDINYADLTGKFVVFNPAHSTSSMIATSTTHALCYNYYSTQQLAAYNRTNGTRYVGKTFIKPGKKYWYKGVWENQKYTLYSMEDNGDFTLETLPDVEASGVHSWENPRFTTSATLTLDDITYTIKASHSSEASPHYKYQAFNYDLTTSDGGWWTAHGDASTTPCWISLHSTTPVCPTEIMLMNEINTPASPKNVEIRGIYSDGTYKVLKNIVVESNTEGLLTTIPIDNTIFFNEIQIYCSSGYETHGVSLQQVFIKGKIDSKYWTKELEFDCEECPIDIYKIGLGNNVTNEAQPLQGFIYLADTKLTYNDKSVTPYQKTDKLYIEDKYTIKKYQEKEHLQTLTNLNYKADVYWYQYLPNVFENTTQKAEMGFSFKPKTAANFTMNSGILQLYDPPLNNNYSNSGTVSVDATTKIATFTSGSFIHPSGLYFNVSDRMAWELKLKIKHTTPNILQEFYRSSESGSYRGLILAVSEENKFKVWANNDESVASWNLANGISGEFEIPMDTWIWIRMYFDGTKYALTYSLDDITYTDDITLYSYKRLSYYEQACRIGSGQNSYFRGEIDLKGVKTPVSAHSYWYPIQKSQINSNSNAFRVWTAGGNINIQLKLNSTNIIDTTRAMFDDEKTYIKLCYDKASTTPWSVYMGYSFDEMTKIGSSSNTHAFTTAFEKLRAQFGHDYITGYTGMNGEIDITDFYLKENDTTIKLKTKATDIADINFIHGTGWAYVKDNYNTIQLTSGCILNNQNILSNFSTNNYARLPEVLNFGACDYEIVFKYKFSDFANEYNCLFGVFEDVDYRMPKIQYYRPDNSVKFYIENTTGTEWQSGTGTNIPGFEIIKNTWLYIMVKREGSVYYIKTSEDKTNWVTKYIYQYKSIPYSNTSYHMALGICCVSTTSHEWFSGEIDLNESYIKIGNNIAWKYIFNDEEITETTMPGLLTENPSDESIITLNAYSCIDNNNKIYTILSKTEPDSSLYKEVILIKENIEIQKDELIYIYDKEKEQFEIEEQTL